jgi:CcmD family protein
MKNFWFLFSAYLFIWIFIFGYVLKLNSSINNLKMKLSKLESEMED